MKKYTDYKLLRPCGKLEPFRIPSIFSVYDVDKKFRHSFLISAVRPQRLAQVQTSARLTRLKTTKGKTMNKYLIIETLKEDGSDAYYFYFNRQRNKWYEDTMPIEQAKKIKGKKVKRHGYPCIQFR